MEDDKRKTRHEDLTGRKFARLSIIRKTSDRSIQGFVIYECQCSCGNTIMAAGSAVKTGLIKSCGCLKREKSAANLRKNHLPHGEAAFNLLYGRYRHNASIKGYSFNLSKDEFKPITKMDCHYCGASPTGSMVRSKSTNGSYIHNGVDRIDNQLGYELNNVVPCCKLCNYAKRDRNYHEFINWIKKASIHLKNKSL